jgi:Lon protease-like protein
MNKMLPARANLEHLKSQAKDLLEAFRRGDASARERVRDGLPSARGASDQQLSARSFALHDAQSVIAREYGFQSFAELRAAVERQGATPEYLRELIQRQMKTPPPAEVVAALASLAQQPLPEPPELAGDLPLLPLRNAVLAAGAVAPLSIARPSTLAAVQAARATDDWIAIFTQRSEDVEAPQREDFHPVGCVAKILKTLPQQESLWLVVRAVSWVTLADITQTAPFLRVRAALFEVSLETNDDVVRIERALRERARALAATSPNAAQLIALLDTLSASALADAVVANLPASVEDKAAYAGEATLRGRLERALELAERAAP